MRRKLKWDESVGILFFLISMGMLAFSVYFCFCSDIWYDELFTMGLANQSCGELISMTARDVHPPLYYLIVRLFLAGVTESNHLFQVVVAKLVSCLPFFLCILFSLCSIRKHFGLLTAGLFSFLLVSMPQMADYTVEIRMYGYALLFITVGMVSAYEVQKDKKVFSYIILTFCALAACYTHYFACVAACMIYFYLFVSMWHQRIIKQMIKPYLLSSFVCIAGYLPWLLLVVTKQVGRVKENYWIQPVSLRTLGGCMKFIFKPSFTDERVNVLLAILFAGIYAALFTISIFLKKKKKEEPEKERKTEFAWGCVFVPAGLVLFGFLASLLIRPVFVYRYMLPAMGVFWLAFAIMAGNLKQNKAVLIPILILLAVTGIRNFRAFYGEEMWKKLQMNMALSEFEQIDKGDIIICNFDQVQGIASYYLPNETYLWYGNTEELIQEMFPQNHSLVEGDFSDEEGIIRIKEFLKEGRKIWFFGSGNARDEILEKWKAEGIESEKKVSAMVEKYWFDFYEITSG